MLNGQGLPLIIVAGTFRHSAHGSRAAFCTWNAPCLHAEPTRCPKHTLGSTRMPHSRSGSTATRVKQALAPPIHPAGRVGAEAALVWCSIVVSETLRGSPHPSIPPVHPMQMPGPHMHSHGTPASSAFSLSHSLSAFSISHSLPLSHSLSLLLPTPCPIFPTVLAPC